MSISPTRLISQRLKLNAFHLVKLVAPDLQGRSFNTIESGQLLNVALLITTAEYSYVDAWVSYAFNYKKFN